MVSIVYGRVSYFFLSTFLKDPSTSFSIYRPPFAQLSAQQLFNELRLNIICHYSCYFPRIIHQLNGSVSFQVKLVNVFETLPSLDITHTDSIG